MSFRERIKEASEEKKTNIVLALDVYGGSPSEILNRSLYLLRETQRFICAIKINLQVLLPLGLFDGVEELVKEAESYGLPSIMDLKLNDVGHTNLQASTYIFEAGFDALIANPFIGWEGGLKPVFEKARSMGRGVILLVYMSHPGAVEGYGQTVQDPEDGKTYPQYVVFAKKALRWHADGVVVGATRPEKISEVKDIVRDEIPIYSPGIGLQGGDPIEAVTSGASYLIVGRTITRSSRPVEEARKLRDLVKPYIT
ncbi:orotidine 5'-phosphate decarboxylase [Candidatus Bathyarchaeota archaeon]|nr:orotidine 5'-phosphate decarboxylase [Candidatus Bathyarchaeota archaeon]